MNEESRNRVPVVGTASLNLAEYASSADGKEIPINVAVNAPVGTSECSLSLCVSAFYYFLDGILYDLLLLLISFLLIKKLLISFLHVSLHLGNLFVSSQGHPYCSYLSVYWN